MMKIVIWIVLFYVVLVSALYFFQRNLIYFPDTEKPEPVQGAEVVKVTTEDGILLTAWYFPPASPERTVLVYFHGNAGHYGHRLPKVQDYLAAGYGVLLAEYRGYGGNPGALGEQAFYRDGRAYMNWLEQEKEIEPDQVVLYGESIGSGVAVQMATEYSVRGLVLEAPFSSLLDVASKTYFFVPVRFLLKDTYNNIHKIGRIKAPILIMHGRKDNVVPFWQGRRLFESAGDPKKFIEIPEGGHNDLYNRGISRFVLEFLDGLDRGDRDKLNGL